MGGNLIGTILGVFSWALVPPSSRDRSIRLSVLILLLAGLAIAALGFRNINIDIPGFPALTRGGTGPAIRPLLVGTDPLQRIEQLKAARQPFYDMADCIIHTDHMTLEEVSRETVKGWGEWARKGDLARGSGEMAPACTVTTTTQSYPVFVGWG